MRGSKAGEPAEKQESELRILAVTSQAKGKKAGRTPGQEGRENKARYKIGRKEISTSQEETGINFQGRELRAKEGKLLF